MMSAMQWYISETRKRLNVSVSVIIESYLQAAQAGLLVGASSNNGIASMSLNHTGHYDCTVLGWFAFASAKRPQIAARKTGDRSWPCLGSPGDASSCNYLLPVRVDLNSTVSIVLPPRRCYDTLEPVAGGGKTKNTQQSGEGQGWPLGGGL